MDLLPCGNTYLYCFDLSAPWNIGEGIKGNSRRRNYYLFGKSFPADVAGMDGKFEGQPLFAAVFCINN